MPGKVKHGKAGTRIYRVWSEMIQRCTNPNNQHWDRYGGRGISVCERWLAFEGFYADMGDCPGPGLSLDRVDNDGNYEPANCRWATKFEQGINRAKKPGCSSSHKGVFWFASRGKWRAAIREGGREKHLGYFDTQEAAAEARAKAELARREAKK